MHMNISISNIYVWFALIFLLNDSEGTDFVETVWQWHWFRGFASLGLGILNEKWKKKLSNVNPRFVWNSRMQTVLN